MPKKEEKPNRRRFDEKERKPWTEEQRKQFLERADMIAPFVRHLTTPAVAEKEPDWFEKTFGGGK